MNLIDMISQLNTTILDDWDDQLPELLDEENIENHFVDNILSIDNGHAEIAYIELYGKIWQVCHNWIPLWRMHSFRDCMSNFLLGDDKYFAIPYDDDTDEAEHKGRELLESLGFRTDSFEGF